MVNFRTAAANTARNLACGIVSSGAAGARAIGDATSAIPGVGAYTGAYANSLGGLERLACGLGPPPGLDFGGPGFTGGQCPVVYVVSANYKFPPNPNLFGGSGEFVGPILDVFLSPGVNYVQVKTSAGTFPLVSTASNAPAPQDLQNVTVTRRDGLPDDCGSIPDDDYRGPHPVEVCYNNGSGIQVCEDFDVTVNAPVVSVGGALIIPFTFIRPTVEFNIDLNLNTDEPIFGPPGSGNGGCCAPTLNPVPPLPAPDEPPDDTTDRPEFTALIVVATSISDEIKATTLNVPDGPNLYIPRLGTVSVRIRFGLQFAWMADVSIKHAKQVIMVPDGYVGSAYAVAPIAGVKLDVTLVTISPEPE